MILSYKYQENSYRLFVDWTSADGKSTVFRDVIKKVADLHGFNVREYLELAEHLDTLTDRLYSQINSFIDEYEAVPFDPRFRRIILKSLSEIIVCVNDTQELGQNDEAGLPASLFMDVTDKLRELVKVYLEERAYQSKYRERLRDKEQYMETTHPAQLSCEFEDVLLQMTDISHHMDCLSETQRRRLVKHVFLKNSMTEIALEEKTTRQAVQKNIASAIKKLRVILSQL